MIERTFVTGFKSFGKILDNPSAILAEGSGRPFQTLEVAYRAVDDFLAGLASATFDRLVMLGVAGGRDRVTPELFARNSIGKTPDVRGYAPIGPISPTSQLLAEGNLWTQDQLSLILSENRHTAFSMDAGNYLCNYIYYQALARFPEKQVGFVHVPTFEKLAAAYQTEILASILSIVETA